MARVVIVGGGLAGLYAAERLHDAGHDVVVVERLERPGGVWVLHQEYQPGDWPWLKLGITATQIEGNCVYTDSGKFCGDLIIEATGFREKTLLELGIFGTRPSGVYTLWTAMRMLEMGWLVGSKAVIYGCNRWAEGLAMWIERRGASAEVFGSSRWCKTARVIKELRGWPRLTQLVTDGGVIDADTLVIAEVIPHNWLGAKTRVGNSAIVIDDIRYMKIAVDFFVDALEEGGFEVSSYGVEIFPRYTAGRVVVKTPGPGYLEVCGKVVYVDSEYTVFEVRRGCVIKYVRSA